MKLRTPTLVFVCVLAITAVPVVGAVDSGASVNESDSSEDMGKIANETETVRNVTETTVEDTTSRTLGVVENVTDIADGSEPSSEQNDSGTSSTFNETADLNVSDTDVVAVPDSHETESAEQETDSTPTRTPESTPEEPNTGGTPTPTAGDSGITTSVNASDQQDTGSDDDDDSPPLLGSLLSFDGGFLDIMPPLGTAMFVALSRPLVGLLSALPSLLSEGLSRFAAVFRYGRRDGSDPLEHETRSRIAELVTDSPGISMSELATDLDTPLSTIRHHLKVLERERVLNSQKIRGNRRLFPVGTENEELVAALEKESSAAIIETLQRYGTATVGDIVDEMETSYSTVSYHLSKLADEGIVLQEKDGATKVTQLAPSVQSLLGTTEETSAPKSPSREVGAD